MRAAFVVLTACGRLGFEEQAITDTPVDQAAAPPTVIANGGGSTESNSTELTVSMPPTSAGNLLVVTFTIHTDAAVTGITDDAGNTYVSAGVRASMANTSSELWYAEQASSASSVDVTLDKVGSFNVYTLELGNVRGAPVKTNSACLEYPPTFVTAPITTTAIDEIIVTVTMFAFPVFISAMLPPFSGLPPQSGNATGYLIAHEPGTFSSTFDIESGEGMTAMTCASSVSWTP